MPKRKRKQLWSRLCVLPELMEQRRLLSSVLPATSYSAVPASSLQVLASNLTTPQGYTSPSGAPITPDYMREAYGLGLYNSSGVTFDGIQGTGAGQTIAIVEAGSDPDISADLTGFDAYWGLPDPPSFQQLNSTGGTSLPNVGDEGELDLDVEWSHVMAPQANIILFDGNLYTAMTTAADWPGVSVISISYTISGTEGISEFETPSGHAGVSFFSAAGDTGAEVNDPAKDPAVIAVGGTDLTVKNNAWSSETGWDASGGGINTAASQPGYQSGIVNAFSTTNRVTPDVSADADPSTGVAVYNIYDNSTSAPWEAIIGGTSLSTPLWAGMVAVADQGRALAGLTSLDGYTQTLPRLYDLYTANYSTNFHDITSGNNGHAAGVGFDEVTGLGSPMANNLIPDLAGADTITGRAYIDTNDDGTYEAGTDTPLVNQTVYLDLGGSGAQVAADPTATTNASGQYTFTDVIGSWTGKVRLAGNAGYLPENNTTLTTAYNTSQGYDLVFASGTTYNATASPTTVTAFNSSLSVTITGTPAANLTYTWSATTEPYGAAPVFSANGTAAAQNSIVTFNLAGTYVLTVKISNGTDVATSSVTIVVKQTATSIAITPVSPNITSGSTQQMTATEYDQFGTAMATQPTNFVWSLTSGGGSINSSTGLYTSPSSGTLAAIKATVSTFTATSQIYVVTSPWVSADIGSPTAIGTAYDNGGVFNISGASTGISTASDQFHYVYRALGGNGTIIAQVQTQTNSNASAGAGLLIRSSLAATAQEVLIGVTPTNGITFESRNTAGGTVTTSSVASIAAPEYVKLVRTGNTITGYYSSNGSSWTLASTTTVAMTGSVYIGMYETSNTAATPSTATIGNVSLMDAADDSVTATATTPGSVNVLTNDVGISGSLTVTSVTQGAYGSVNIGSGGIVTYTTTSLNAGTDAFTYTVTDGAGDTATATVNVSILGLVAHYEMNEGTGTTTADATGNGYTGTLSSNATWTTGVAGDGVNFNGSSSDITLPVMNLSTNIVTFSGWFDSAGTQATDSGLIFNRNGSAAQGLDMYNGTTLGYSWGTSAGTYNWNSGLLLPTGTWTFVALVITPTNATIYMEPLGGTLTHATNTLANATEPFNTAIVIGEDTNSSTRNFNGSSDEVRIYNTNLSLGAITSLASTSSLLTANPDSVTAYVGSPGTVNVLANDSGPNNGTLSVTGFTQPAHGTLTNNGGGSFTYTTASLISGTDSFTYTLSDGLGDTTTGTVNVTIDGMIAYYKFDEGSGTTTADATGDGYTGTLNNTTWTTGLTGLSTDHALAFNGSNTTVSFANSPSLNGTGDFSVAAWVKTTLTSGGYIIEQRDANGYEGEYELVINSTGTVTFYVYNNGYQFDITTTTKVNDGNWHQITADRNGSSGFIYIDGVQAATGSGTPVSLTSTITVTLGADARDDDYHFKGTLDDVMIFDNALSASELTTFSTLGPLVTTPAAASPTTVTTTTTALSVLGSDYYESSTPLTYTWAATTLPTGATAPTYSVNANSSANATTATFYKAGSYVFTVTLKDQSGLTTTSTVSVTVSQTATAIVITPASASLSSHASQTFTAVENDQFGNAMPTQPTFAWSITGSGSINASTGAYTAGYATGTATVTASAGAFSQNAAVTVTNTAPVVSVPTENPSPITAKTVTLTESASDDAGTANLIYTWTTTGSPPAAVTFSSNGNASAASTVVSFTKAGTYTFHVTVTDDGGLSNTSNATVTVNQTVTSITLSNTSVAPGNTVQATAYDQFGNALTTAPTWSATGGTITTAGVYTPGATGGSYTITATTGGIQSSTGVTVIPTTYNGTTGNDTYAIRLSPTNSSLEQIFVNTSESNTPTYTVAISELSSLSFTTASDGALTIDFTNGNPLPSSGINYSGGNILSIKGAAAGGMGFTINGTQVVDTAAASSPIVYSSLKTVELDLAGGSNTLTQLTQPAAAVNYNAGSGSNTLNVSGGTYTFGTDPALASGSLTVNDSASVVFIAPAAGSGYNPRNLAALNITGTASAVLTASNTSTDRTVLELDQLTISVGGSLDIGNNAMIVHNGNLPAITNLIETGFNAGSGYWNGAGISSSTAQNDTTRLTAIGVMPNNISGVAIDTTFDNQPTVATDVLIKYTYFGDTNLDGKVDGSDYSRIDNGLLTHATGWFNGDFNYDGSVNGSDYTLIDNAFNQQGGTAAAQVAAPTAQIASSAKTVRPRVAGQAYVPPNTFQSGSPIQFPASADSNVESLMLKKDILDKLSGK
jgi:hypothetical protein